MKEISAVDTPAPSAEALLAMEDAEFVLCAYISVLGRPADPVGFSEYLAHIRAGADKAHILAAMAASPEAKRKDSVPLAGLKGVVRQAKRSALLPFSSRRTSQRLKRRVDVCEYRLSKMERSFSARLDKLEKDLSDLLHNHRRMQGTALSPALQDPELKVKLREMSFHARSIYSRLEDAVKEQLRTSLT